MSKVALVIIYNHQYNKNIDVLERLYQSRFDHVFHLVPFYQGHKPNVIAVYENSFYFQGYVAQGARSFIDSTFDHYLFVADDMVINPVLNQKNYTEHLRLDADACFIPELITLHKRELFWPRVAEAFRYRVAIAGVEAEGQLPVRAEAISRFEKFGLEQGPIDHASIFQRPVATQSRIRGVIDWLKYLKQVSSERLSSRRYELSYPLVGSYTDIFAVSAQSIDRFCHYCGVFAATRLHVEIAIPTAMVLSAEKIVTEKELALKGKALWPDGWARLSERAEVANGDYAELERYGSSLKSLCDQFPGDYLYLHPIKLSQWTVD